MDEREFFDEKSDKKPANLSCPHCHESAEYEIQWLVRMKKNSIIGGLVVADVVLKTPPQPPDGNVSVLQREILQFCRGELAQHKVPAAIRIVPSLEVTPSGKVARPNA